MLARRTGVRLVALTTVLVVAALAAQGVPRPASAVAIWHFVGKVLDPLGDPIPGATVSDGAQHATTANDGTYSLGENGSGTYTLTAMAVHHAQQAEQATVVTPADTTVNFSLPYLISGELDQSALQSTLATSATLTITDWAPSGGSCVTVSDSRTGESTPATLATENADESSTWHWALQVPQGTAEGDYLLSIGATRCTDSTVVTTAGTTPYVVDNTPPSITDPSPTGYVGSTTALVRATVKDDLSGIDVAKSDITVNGQSLPQPYSFDTSSGVLSATATGLAQGAHHVAITAVDGAGNAAVLSYGFSVDTIPPGYSGQAPTGETGMTPLISVGVADDAPISPGSVTMVLSMGPVSCHVQPAYAPTTGEITYQVPSSPTGPCLGQSPLLPGTYEVVVSSTDAAGNVGSTTWSFVVDPHPVAIVIA